ncbi:MAG: glycosyltransferase family 39 protein [Ginsengibacter sp.]
MNKTNWILVGFLGLKFFLQYILLSPAYDLQRDEYLHLDLGKHLAWGYASVPPVTSWISFLIDLLGNSIFWVKFFPALFGALTILFVWKAIEELKGSLFALVLGATCVLFSSLLRLNTLYQPNSLDVLCWTACYFFIIKYFNSEKAKWLYIASIIFAFGFLNKYNIVFLLAGIIPAILLTQQRNIFLKREFYISILLVVLLILPNLIWQYQNDFPVIYHLKELAETQLINVSRRGFLKSQLSFFFGSLIVIFAGIVSFLFYEPFKKHRPFFWAFIFTLIIFIYLKAKDYYAIGLYPIYISFGAVFLGHVLKVGWKKYLQPVLILIPVLIFIPMYQFAFPNKSPEYIIAHSEIYKKTGSLRWEDGKDHDIPQDYADMLSWKELAYKVDSLYKQLPDKSHTLILCDNYGQAGAINFYTNQSIQAVSFNADYVNWIDIKKTYSNLIRVKDYKKQDEELNKTRPYFENSFLADSITNKYAREYGTKIYVFIHSKVDINQRIKMEIKNTKVKFRKPTNEN